MQIGLQRLFFLHDYALLAIEKTNKYLKKNQNKAKSKQRNCLSRDMWKTLCEKYALKNQVVLTRLIA